MSETTTGVFDEIRADLVRVGLAHERRAMAAVAALPEGKEDAPPWLYDAWRGSTMASMYALTLAAVLRDVEDRLSEEDLDDVLSNVQTILENGTEGENEDVWQPAEVSS